jgi:hypothetical protein
MHCHICDAEDDLIVPDRQAGGFTPCRVCQAIIYETVCSYDDDEYVLIEDEDEENDDFSTTGVDYS